MTVQEMKLFIMKLSHLWIDMQGDLKKNRSNDSTLYDHPTPTSIGEGEAYFLLFVEEISLSAASCEPYQPSDRTTESAMEWRPALTRAKLWEASMEIRG